MKGKTVQDVINKLTELQREVVAEWDAQYLAKAPIDGRMKLQETNARILSTIWYLQDLTKS